MSDVAVEQPSSKPKARAVPVWLLPALIVAGLIVAVASEPVIAANRERFFTATGLPPFPPELLWKVFWDNVYNHSICYGFVGIALCGLLGMVAGAVSGPAQAVKGLLIGAVLGIVAGIVIGVSGWYWSNKILDRFEFDSLLKAVLIFVPVWFAFSLVTSWLALFANGRVGLFKKAFKPAIVFASLATFAYVAVVTVILPSDWPGYILPEHARVRIVLELTGCVGVALATFGALRIPDATEATGSNSVPSAE